MKLPFGKGGSKGDDDLFDDASEDLDNLGPSNLGDLETYEVGSADRIRSLGGGRGWIKLAALLALVLVGGGATGYWLVSGGGHGDEAPAVAEAEPAEPPPEPEQPAEQPAEEHAQAPEEPASDGASILHMPMPTRDGAAKGGETLISPPTKDALAETDKSVSRRPWLQLDSSTAAQGGQGAALPGVVATDAPLGAMTEGPKISPIAQPPAPAAPEPAAPETPPAETAQAETPPAAPEAVAEAPPEAHPTETPPEAHPAEAPPETPPAETPAAETPQPAPEPAETALMQPPPAAETPAATPPADAVAAAAPAAQQPVDPPMPGTRTNADGQPTRAPAFRDLAKNTGVQPLPPAPIEGFSEETRLGPLPVIAEDGSRAWQVYARPFEAQTQSRIGLVVTGLGLRKDATEAAITLLPPQVTLAFSPYAQNLQQWIALARQNGHEVLIALPMEPANFPARDPGPYGLLTLLSAEENVSRLESVLAKATGYVGVIAFMGERFLSTTQYVGPVMNTLSKRGLIYVGNGAGVRPGAMAPKGLAYAAADVVIDEKMFRESIDARLRHLTVIAQTQQSAVGLLSATPASMTQVVKWAAALPAAGIELAPITAVVKQ